MPKRRIVPDNSVVIPAFFDEPLTPKASVLRLSIIRRDVIAYAPDILVQEFLKIALTHKVEMHGRQEVLDRIDDFAFVLMPKVEPIPALHLVNIVLDLGTKGLHMPDSWYVASALLHDAELVISHEQRDQVVKQARMAGADVRLLRDWK